MFVCMCVGGVTNFVSKDRGTVYIACKDDSFSLYILLSALLMLRFFPINRISSHLDGPGEWAGDFHFIFDMQFFYQNYFYKNH